MIVLVDGLRLDASRGQPALDALRARGVDVPARAPYPTISKANYVTIGSGVPPRFSGSRTNDGFREHAIDSVFARMRAAGRSTAYVADRTRGLARLFGIEDRLVAPLGHALTTAFAYTLARAELVVLKLMEVDVAGHADGGDSAAYRAAVAAIDAQLGSIAAGFDFTRDAIIVVADHGHTDRGGHGGLGDDVERVPFVLAGAGVRSGVRLTEEANLVDVAPTAAALLGVAAPRHALGRTLVDALVLAPAHREALVAVDARRHAYLAPITAAIERADADRYRATWIVRLPLALLAIAVLGGLSWLLARRHRIDRTMVIAASVFPVVFLALVFGVDRIFALPSVPAGRLSIWGATGLYGGIAALLHAVTAVIVLRRPAVGLLLLGLLFTATPALLAWALAGPALATMLPRTEVMLLAPVTYAGLAYFAVATLLAIAARGIALLVR